MKFFTPNYLFTEMSTNHSSVGQLCKRCNKEPSVVFTRNDPFCRGCFVRFIRGKQRKQMTDDRFKVKFNINDEQTPVVFDFMLEDHSSLVLFDILVELLKEQQTMGPRARVGFLLNTVIIDNAETSHAQDVVSQLKGKYGKETLQKLGVRFTIINPDSYCQGNQMNTVNLRQHYNVDIIKSDSSLDYQSLISQVSDQSTREDLVYSIRDDLLARYAQDGTIVIKSDSMTNLAIDILSLTIQGKGNEVATVLTDTETLFHPLRDVLHSELRVYCQLEGLDQILPEHKRQLVKPESKSTKNKTVHELVSEYFQTIELEYPEVVSTVEKIGSKLNSPEGTGEKCPVCNKNIQDDAKQWLEQITVNGFAAVESEEDRANLERYNEAMQAQGKLETAPIGEPSKLCYGCLVTLNASGMSSIQWPKRQTDAEILDEYILTDSED